MVFTLKVTIFPSLSVSLSIVFLSGVGYCERSRSRFLYFNRLHVNGFEDCLPPVTPTGEIGYLRFSQ